jgi:hypothetical protein
LIGDTDEILRILAIIFLLTDPEKRSHLSFETYSYGTNWTRSWPFWAWGAPQDGILRSDYIFHLKTQKYPEFPIQTSLNPYEQWVVNSAIPSGLENLLVEGKHALALQQALTGTRLSYWEFQEIDPRFVNSFLRSNNSYLSKAVLKQLPEGLSVDFQGIVWEVIEQDPIRFFNWLQEDGQPSQKAARLLFTLILEKPILNLSKSDIKMINNIAEDTGLTALSTILKIKTGKISHKDLDRLTSEEYRQIVLAFKDSDNVKSHDLFSLRYLPTWSELCSKQLEKGQIKAVLDRITESKIHTNIDPLINFVPYMDQGDIKTLTNWLKSYKGPAVNLRDMLESKDKSHGSISKWLKNFFFYEDDKEKTGHQNNKR